LGGDDTVNSKDSVNGNDTLRGGAGTDTKITDTQEKSILGSPYREGRLWVSLKGIASLER
jgi:hypothetical protein